MKVSFYTLGCKVNSYESDVLTELFYKDGFDIVDFGETCDVCVIHTCAVTEKSARKSRQMMRRARKLCPFACIVVLGCLPQISEISMLSDADIIMGNTNKTSLLKMVRAFLSDKNRKIAVEDISNEKVFEKMTLTSGNTTRAQVKIQDGCNNFCSYCIIPYARGRVRSKPLNEAVSEIENLVRNGYQEIVLTGIHLDSYGKDFGDYGLCDLLEKIHAERIRLGSLEPLFITEESVGRLKNIEGLCPHFHLSLQSGCEDTLRRMNRKYTPEQYEKAVTLLRENFKDCAITTDIITGFPGETEDEFLQSYTFAKRIGFSKIHVFPYSPRLGTAAADMENQVATEIKNKRDAKMIELSTSMTYEFLEGFLERTMPVLFEHMKDGFFIGHTPNYIEIKVESDMNLKNKIYMVKIEKNLNAFCFGTLEKEC